MIKPNVCWSGVDSTVSDVDGLPYPTLLYGNGPGHHPRGSASTNSSGRDSLHPSAVPRHWATHGGEDVPVYAQGPLATTLFSGTMDQSVIPHAIAYIGCLGEYSRRCQGEDDFPEFDDRYQVRRLKCGYCNFVMILVHTSTDSNAPLVCILIAY